MPPQEIPLAAFINSDTEDGIPIPVNAPKFDEKNCTLWNGALSNTFRRYRRGLYFFGNNVDIQAEDGGLSVNGQKLDADTVYHQIRGEGTLWMYDATHVISEAGGALRYGEIQDAERIAYQESPLRTGLHSLYVVANSQKDHTVIVFLDAVKTDRVTFSVYDIQGGILHTLSEIAVLIAQEDEEQNHPDKIRVSKINNTRLSLAIEALSATLLFDGSLIIGCTTDSVLTSFALVLPDPSAASGTVIMGCGAVHPTGDLYGNILPAPLLDPSLGLIPMVSTGTPENVEFALDVDAYPAFGERKTVLDNNHIYYYDPEPYRLVSHFAYAEGAHTPHEIDLVNAVTVEKYTAISDHGGNTEEDSWSGAASFPLRAWAVAKLSGGVLGYGLLWNTGTIRTGLLTKRYEKTLARGASSDAGNGVGFDDSINLNISFQLPACMFASFSTLHAGTPYGIQVPLQGLLFLYPQNQTVLFARYDEAFKDSDGKHETYTVNEAEQVFILESFNARLSAPSLPQPGIELTVSCTVADDWISGGHPPRTEWNMNPQKITLSAERHETEEETEDEESGSAEGEESEPARSGVKLDIAYFDVSVTELRLKDLLNTAEGFDHVEPKPDAIPSQETGTYPTAAPFNSPILAGLYFANFGDGSGYISHDNTKLTSASLPNNMLLLNAEEQPALSGTPLIAAAHAVIQILPFNEQHSAFVKHRIISNSLLLFNVNKKNALVTVGGASFLTHACSGYITDVLIRPKGPAQTQIDFQYTAWEHNPHLITGNLYPLSSIMGNPRAKILCPSQDLIVTLYTASNADAEITKKTSYKNGSPVTVNDALDPYADTCFAVDIFFEPVGIRPPIGLIFEGTSKALTLKNAQYNPVIGAPGSIASLPGGAASSLSQSAAIQFIIYENKYAILNNEIYAIDEANGVETYRLVNPNIGGLRYLGSSSAEAYFYSETLDRIMLFTGSGTVVMGELISRFGTVNKAYWSSLRNKMAINITPQTETANKVVWRSAEGYEYQLHLTSADNELSIIDGNEGLVFQHTAGGNLFYFSIHEKPVYAEIIEHRVSGDDYTGYTHNPFRLKTSFLGQSPAVTICVDKFVIVFYKTALYEVAHKAVEGAAEKGAAVEVRAFTFDQGKFFENPQETLTLPPPSQWNASTLVYEYPLRYHTGVSFSLDIYSADVISIVALAIDVQPDSNPAPGTVRHVIRHKAGNGT